MWIERITIRGFRSFTDSPQSVDLSRGLNVIYADNSQGKTSFAEALEFLLTGSISRRTFTGSTTREFAECLRNAHMASSGATAVEAVFADGSGSRRTLRRVLVSDFASNRDCTSSLTLDGLSVSDPSAIVRLSEPPLQTPILLQHSLRYVLSAKPQDRANYFKAILDIAALDRVYDVMVKVAEDHEPTPSLLQQRAATLIPLDQLAGASGIPSAETVISAVHSALRESLQLGMDLSGESLEREAQTRLSEQSESRFPFAQVEVAPFAPQGVPTATVDRLEAAAQTLAAGATADSALLKLYEASEPLLPLAGLDPVECPLCQSTRALLPSRVDGIRQALSDSRELRAARQVIDSERQALSRWLEELGRSVASLRPGILQGDEHSPPRSTVRQALLALLLGGDSHSQIEAWEASIAPLKDSITQSLNLVTAASSGIRDASPEQIASTGVIDSIRSLPSVLSALSSALQAYQTAFAPLRIQIRTRLAGLEALSRPRELLGLIPAAEELAADIATFKIRSAAVAALKVAADQVREANKRILDDKFDSLSDEIGRWWGLLRPDELSNFSGLQRSGGGRRYLDVKAGLQTHASSLDQVERDAVAVFSDSQLNCLGLSAFLARISREEAGFVVLDDPIQASDEEHRFTFVGGVPDALLSAGRQVIILTHDQRLARDLQDRYSHFSPSHIQIALEDPLVGSTLALLRDTIEIQLTRAQHLVQGAGLDPRRRASQILRTEAERLCKQIMVASRRRSGDNSALLSDYDSMTLDPLIAAATPMLDRDPAHPGKLRVIGRTLNPGNHDDGVPSGPALRQCIGDLRGFLREYL